MSAQILRFPSNRQRALEPHELPADWTDAERFRYGYLTADGYTPHERAFDLVQAEHDEPPQQPGESRLDYLARRAMIGVRSLPMREG